jgi:septation ring formation regulator EzrA
MHRSIKRELIEARSKLHNFSSKPEDLIEAEKQVDTLQTQLHRLIEQNQKQKLNQLLEEQESLSQQQLKPPTPPMAQTDLENNNSTQEENVDAITAQGDSSKQPEHELEEAVERMQKELNELQTKRKSLIKEISYRRASPANERHQDYKRLIALCCGVEYDNVDVLLNPLLEALDAEDSPRTS